jgi:hypothetical protein
MKVMVEIHDSQVIAALQDAAKNKMHNFFRQHPDDMAESVRLLDAMNEVIEYFGGDPVDVGIEIARQRI